MGTVTIAQGTQLLPQPWPSRERMGEIDHLPLSPSFSQAPPRTSYWLNVTRGKRAKEAGNAVHSGLLRPKAGPDLQESLQSWEAEKNQYQARGWLFTLRAWGPRIKVPTGIHSDTCPWPLSPTGAVKDPETRVGWAEKCPHWNREERGNPISLPCISQKLRGRHGPALSPKTNTSFHSWDW